MVPTARPPIRPAATRPLSARAGDVCAAPMASAIAAMLKALRMTSPLRTRPGPGRDPSLQFAKFIKDVLRRVTPGRCRRSGRTGSGRLRFGPEQGFLVSGIDAFGLGLRQLTERWRHVCHAVGVILLDQLLVGHLDLVDAGRWRNAEHVGPGLIGRRRESRRRLRSPRCRLLLIKLFLLI